MLAGCVRLWIVPLDEHYDHPALIAMRDNSLACLRVALKNTSAWKVGRWELSAAAQFGEEMLQLVHEIAGGGALGDSVAGSAVYERQVGAFRYALRNGAPLSIRMFE